MLRSRLAEDGPRFRSLLCSCLSKTFFVIAAKSLGHVGDVRRFPTEQHFASHTGTAPA